MIFGGGGVALNTLGGGEDYQGTIDYGNNVYGGWYDTSNDGNLVTTVSDKARDKFTRLDPMGDNKATIMVYMCGTDLESNQGMATKDLNEMINAEVGRNVNLLVYTGGCKKWRNNVISSKYNQIYQIKNGNIKCLVENAGTGSMTNPDTLSEFIRWAHKNFPANRNSLILWDHGSGSISGYGYDEKNPVGGSMKLNGIDRALTEGGVQFDFVGFDACLMGTSETALMLSKHADYMIGSEEIEPGIGWYYTSWLTLLNDDTSIATLQLGKVIADDYTEKCASQCRGQATTLSVVDLSELGETLPKALDNFSADASDMISNGEYKEVATARSSAKEFQQSSRLDQVDLVHFAKLMGTDEGKELADTLLSAIKYNRASKNIVNSYGLSIYFPCRTLSKVDSILAMYDDINMGDKYSDCITKFAQMQASGQAGYGGYGSPGNFGGGSWFGNSSSGSTGNQMNEQALEQLFEGLFSGRANLKELGLGELNADNSHFLQKGELDPEAAAECVSENMISDEDLQWQTNADGKKCIKLTEKQWGNVDKVDMSMYYDDGEGYIDLGLDNIYDFDDDGNLLPNLDRNWLAIYGQPVAYYHTDTIEKGGDAYVIRGYVPIQLNGEDARLILSFDNNNDQGYVSGVSYYYDPSVTETEAKTLNSLKEGDKIKFVCDFYDYDGNFNDRYQLGETETVNDIEHFQIRNVDVGNGPVKIAYKFTDLFGNEHWTPVINK